MASKGFKGTPWGQSAPDPYGDTVTVVVPRKTAEDFYYAIALAMGGGTLDEFGWAPGKNGNGLGGKDPGGKGFGGKAPGPKR
jgi:hypothetical protein